eukprot:GFUD01099333.1.p1 GENE.GFUD01099333.1~~GFUD01099333.1.p1  ORF type:complete len:397 (-),score=80.51 GFUD01099333.1:13-1203(-)
MKFMLFSLSLFILFYHINGWKCIGHQDDISHCCSPKKPCMEGEGDCENDAECRGNLVCGTNNCKRLGEFYPDKGNCCEKQVQGQRCSGRNYQGRRCCTPESPCNEGEGDCDGPGDGGEHDGHAGCIGDLVCGSNNCRQFGQYYHEKDDCCQKPSKVKPSTSPDTMLSTNDVPLEPPTDQRCSGRNYQGGRCCTPDNPCDEGEGDCDGPDDGGQHDGHAGCKGDLICGSNNCKQYGLYYHDKDDCCQKPSQVTGPSSFTFIQSVPDISTSVGTEGNPAIKTTQSSDVIPIEPPAGQRCKGRNFEPGRRCCTPENPCDEGEGDCDGRGDGGFNDGDCGCKGDLVCGSNNCLQFGFYYHEKDDCCEKSPVDAAIKKNCDVADVVNVKLPADVINLKATV